MVAPLSRAFNVATLQIAARLFPCGFDVRADAPDSLERLVSETAATGRLAVWSGASEQTIFGDPEVNWAFRAWHDWHHYRHRLPFTPEGEREAAAGQQRDIRALYGRGPTADHFCALVEAEVVGQLHHQQRHGAFPEDQAGFVAAYLVDPTAALARRW